MPFQFCDSVKTQSSDVTYCALLKLLTCCHACPTVFQHKISSCGIQNLMMRLSLLDVEVHLIVLPPLTYPVLPFIELSLVLST